MNIESIIVEEINNRLNTSGRERYRVRIGRMAKEAAKRIKERIEGLDKFEPVIVTQPYHDEMYAGIEKDKNGDLYVASDLSSLFDKGEKNDEAE